MIDKFNEELIVKEVRNKVINLEKEIIASNVKMSDVEIVELIARILEESIKKHENKTDNN